MITHISKGPRDLFLAPDTPPGHEWIYQGGFVFQISPTEAGMFTGIRLGKTAIIDVEAGVDLTIFDQVDKLRTDRTVRLARYHEMKHPRTGESIYASPGITGGFVPLGAKRADGSPHPHAGTGYGVNHWMGFPTALEAKKDTHVDTNSDVYFSIELQQYAYDGKTFRITRSDKMEDTELLPGWQVAHHSFSAAIPSGDDLLSGLATGNMLKKCETGFARWRRGNDGCWRPIEYQPLMDGHAEPSLVRDIDGSLLMSFRPYVMSLPEKDRLRIWRSTDEGKTWKVILDQKPFWQMCPMILSRATDGTPYLAINRYREPVVNRFAKREMIWAYPLSEDRTKLLDPIVVRDATVDFGPPPHGTKWRVDHPVGTTVRLADGRWHHVLVYRGLEDAEMRTDAAATPFTGLYMEEVFSNGTPLPTWRF